MDVIQKKTNTRIANTLSRLRAKPSFVKSAKYTWVRETGRRGTGHIYFRGLLGFDLYMTDHLFADNEGYFVFGVIMPKILLKFLLSHITFDDLADQQENWYTDHFAAMKTVWESFNYNLSKYVAPS